MTDMRTVALSEAKDKLSALVEEADSTHEIIQITRHGHAAAVLMSADDLESLQETLRILSTPEARDELSAAMDSYRAGGSIAGEDLRLRYGLAELPDAQ